MKQSKKIALALSIRQADYAKMVGQQKIGDGHRDATGYHKPGGKTGSVKRVKSGNKGF